MHFDIYQQYRILFHIKVVAATEMNLFHFLHISFRERSVFIE